MEALKLFQEYMGTGLIMIWFLISLLYLWLTEKRKHIRVMFLYVPLVLLFVFFTPLVAKLVSGLADGEIYYRILWLLPVTPVIAYAAGQAMKAWGRGERWIPTVCAVLGGILGAVGLYVMPGFPANDVITAAAIGMVSGLAATGAHQAVKQLCTGPDCGKTQ